MKELLARLKASKPYRVWDRFGETRGNLLAGGIAYAALFSLFPALAIGFTTLGLVVGDDDALKQEIVDTINANFGDRPIIGMEPGDGGFVSISTLVRSDVLTWTGSIALAGLLLTGLGWIDALRQGIRAVFGLGRLASPVLKKVQDVVALLVLGLLVLTSVVVSLVLSSASTWVLNLVGLDSPLTRVLVRVLVELAVLAVDVGLFLAFFLAVARIGVSARQLLSGAVVGAIGLHVLKLASGLLMAQASSNAFLASAAIVVGLLLWFNLVGRLTLLAAAWSAVTLEDRGVAVRDVAESDDPEREGVGPDGLDRGGVGRQDGVPALGPARPGPGERPVPVIGRRAVATPGGARPVSAYAVGPARVEPNHSQRSADRVGLAAGAVLGGTVMLGLGLLGRGLRSVRDGIRGG